MPEVSTQATGVTHTIAAVAWANGSAQEKKRVYR